MRLHPLLCLLCGLLPVALAQAEPNAEIAKEIANLSTTVLSEEQQAEFQQQTWRNLRARGDEVNHRNVAKWRAVKSREDWEKLREQALENMKSALGTFPDIPETLNVKVTRKIKGDGFVIENLVYQTRPGLWVTANLYKPESPVEKMPGILIAHSHHRPKTQDELQDMGMTWARAGCLVLVIDQLGHGERADHPFQSEQDYKKDSSYKWWRQDYYYRFDTNAQLDLVGESLMGWMAWDLMRGVDLLLAQPGIDAKKIILLGAVAGGGDPAAVTAALDQRITAAVPFNFGGPQPETRFPLPDDAELHFDYLGGAYWESTRNLRGTGSGDFLHWVIVGSIAPRKLIYAHEFAWDKEHDPVWKRLNTLYGFYDTSDNIDYTLGRGSVKGRPPEATHCTNIGPHHRKRIHAAFNRWFDIKVSPADEYSERLDSADLRSMTDEAQQEIKPLKLCALLTDQSHEEVETARTLMESKTPEERRKQLQADWQQLLGDIQPRDEIKVLSQVSETLADKAIVVERIALQTEPNIILPILMMYPSQDKQRSSQIIVAVSQSGMKGFLRDRSAEIASLLEGGSTVCLLDVRDAGTNRGDFGAGGNGSTSFYALFFETPMLGYRLRDLRAALEYLRTRKDLQKPDFALWGDSFALPNPAETDFQVPKRVSGRPRFSEPLGGLLAMLGALYENDVQAVYIHGGLSAFAEVMKSPYVYVPHDIIVPGVLNKGDLADLAAGLAPCPLCLEGLVDGLNRKLSRPEVQAIYATTSMAYETTNPESISFGTDKTDAANWFLKSKKAK